MLKRPALLVLGIAALFVLVTSAAVAGVADDVQGTWAGSHAEIDPGPPEGDGPGQAELDAHLADVQLVIDAAAIEKTTRAGQASHAYTVVSEAASSLTVETAMGNPMGSGGVPRTVVLELVDANTLRLRLGAGDGYLAVFTRE